MQDDLTTMPSPLPEKRERVSIYEDRGMVYLQRLGIIPSFLEKNQEILM
jgi:hypothetical protein